MRRNGGNCEIQMERVQVNANKCNHTSITQHLSGVLCLLHYM